MWIVVGICVLVIAFLILLLKRTLKLYFTLCESLEELDFSMGETEIPEHNIIQKFENVTLLYNVQKSTNYAMIVDTSRYLTNNLIGLTYLVPAHEYDTLANDVSFHVKEKVKNEYEDADIDQDWLDQSIHETMNGVLVPCCDVYQLKSGKWIWRSKLEYSSD